MMKASFTEGPLLSGRTERGLGRPAPQDGGELPGESDVVEILKPPALARDHAGSQVVVESKSSQQFSCLLEVLWRKLHARAGERIGDGRRRIRQNGQVGRHGLHER